MPWSSALPTISNIWLWVKEGELKTSFFHPLHTAGFLLCRKNVRRRRSICSRHFMNHKKRQIYASVAVLKYFKVALIAVACLSVFACGTPPGFGLGGRYLDAKQELVNTRS